MNETVSPIGCTPESWIGRAAHYGAAIVSVTRAAALVGFLAVAQNPDPQLAMTSLTGATRTLDDWTTVFNLALVMLPDRPEARAFLPVIERIFATFGDSDVRTVVCVPSTAAITPPDPRRRRRPVARVRGSRRPRSPKSLGLERLPAFVHLRQDTTLVAAAQGWSPTEWQRVADEVAKQPALDLASSGRTQRSAAQPGLAHRLLSGRRTVPAGRPIPPPPGPGR